MKTPKKTLEIFVDIVPLPLSTAGARIMRRLDRYDHIVFTSRNAQKIFEAALARLRIPVPRKKIIRVGPRADLLKLDLRGRRILFPRSALAPFDIVRKLRARRVTVTPLTLYTARGRVLSTSDRRKLVSGKVDQLYFKSPSGVTGLLGQFSKKTRAAIKKIPVLCVGETTAKAARSAGFKRLSIKKV